MASTDPPASFTETAFQKHVEKWKKIAFSTSRVDQERVREGVTALYNLARVQPPSLYIWLDSPIAGALAASVLSKHTSFGFEPEAKGYQEALRGFVAKRLEKHPNKDWWEGMQKRYTESINRSYGRVAQEVRRAIQLQLGGTTNEVMSDFAAESIGMARAPEGSKEAGLTQWEGGNAQLLNKLIEDLERQLPISYRAATAALKGDIGLRQVYWSAVSSTHSCFYGNLDPELAFHDFCSYAGMALPQLKGPVLLAQSCGWWWPLKSICIVTPKPMVLRTDESGNLTSIRGPSIQYPDSWGFYAWRNQIVPPRFINFARNPSAADIVAEGNSEVRRMMLELFGLEQFMLASGAQKIQEDECGALYVQQVNNEEPIVTVCCINSTPEPDGHFKRYFLRVPPDTKTAREGIAWTFGMKAEEWNPKKQT